jgi:hypothetical protein
MANDTALETVEWNEGGLANEDVYNWFSVCGYGFQALEWF